MALRNLTTEAMYAISSPWVEAGSAAQIVLQSSPLLAGLSSRLGEVHAGIADVRPVDASIDQALREEASELDFTHDVLVRALHGTLIAVAELTGDEVFAELAALMFPRGLATVQLSHLEQVGHAELVRERLSAEQRELLDQIVVRGNPLSETVDRWFVVADELGGVLRKRASLNESTQTERGQTNRARAAWISIGNVLTAVASHANLTPDADKTLFGPLREAEERADARSRRRFSSTRGDTPTADTDNAAADGPTDASGPTDSAVS